MNRFLPILAGTLLCAGCVSRTVRHTVTIPPITINVSAADPAQAPKDSAPHNQVSSQWLESSPMGQIIVGVSGFRVATAHWPQDRQELETWMITTNPRGEGLAGVKLLSLKGAGEQLKVRFEGIDKSSGTLTLSPEKITGAIESARPK